jgi:hypothetical protein
MARGAREAVNPYLGDREIDLTGMRVGAAEFEVNVAELPDGTQSQFPVAAGVAASSVRKV